jgi:4-diphosphocytidyl-2-C-methyl-D-erythritol kinase
MRWIGLQESVVVWAPAKVNLFLEVLGKRPDGYHEIATLMLAIRRYDTLWFQDGAEGHADVRLSCNRDNLSTGPDNLIVRAARLLQERTGCTRGCRIRLVKRIPLAAGLAGGSSDAAATLVALNQLWQLGLARTELIALGAELGSDVAFFFHTPAAWCTGRGEIVTPVAAPRALDLVLVCPNFGCATAEVYRNLVVLERPADGSAVRDALAAGDMNVLGRLLHNRLEPAAQKVAPRLAELRQRIETLRPAGTLLSGSGSTLFALCRSAVEAARIATELRRDANGEYEVFVTQSSNGVVEHGSQRASPMTR